MLKINLRRIGKAMIEDLEKHVSENNIKWYLRSIGWVELSDGKWVNTRDSSIINGSFMDAYSKEKANNEKSKVS